jgi:hypothetical protein
MIKKFFIATLFLLVILVAVKLSFKLYINSDSHSNLPWAINSLDKLARKDQSCTVLLTHDDDDIEDAVVEIVDGTCEQGLPHTSDKNTIRMTLDSWNNESRRHTILKHERIHLLQKRDPEAWKQFYTQHWGYTHLLESPPPLIPSSITEMMRSNPDTVQHPWVCWQNRYWFIPAYNDPAHPTLKDTTSRVWDQVLQNFVDTPHEWKMLFCSEEGCPYQFEHPHEISAEYLSSDQQPQTPAFASLRSWFHGRALRTNLPEKI